MSALAELTRLESHSQDDRIRILNDIKMSILGNDKEKDKLLKDNMLDEIVAVLNTSNNERELELASIIVQSFSYLKTNTDHILKRNIFSTLLTSCIRHPLLCKSNFKTLIDLLVYHSESQINLSLYDQSTADGLMQLLVNILESPNTDSTLLFNTCMLVPYLESLQINTLLIPLLQRLSQLILPVYAQVLKLNDCSETSPMYLQCEWKQATPSPPLSKSLSSDIAPLLYALAHVIDSCTLDTLKLPLPLYYTLTSFLKVDNYNVKLSALNVLTVYARRFLSGEMKTKNYHKLIPSLIHLVSRTRDVKFDEFTLNSNFKLSRKMSPLFLLSRLSEDDESVNDYLAGCNFIDKICEIVIANYKFDADTGKAMPYVDESTLYKVSDCLLILSCACASKESYREEVARYTLGPILIDIISRHVEIYKVFLNRGTQVSDDEIILKMSNRIALFACYLIRSLSRSAALLRTYLVDLKMVGLLVDILQLPELTSISPELQDSEILLKSLVMGITCNVILDFSALKGELLEHDIISILADFISNTKHDIIRLNSLLIIRNFLFGDDIVNKTNFIQKVSLEKIFELCYDPNLKIKEQCFNILSNLTFGSFNYSNQVIQTFPRCSAALKHGDLNFLQFLCDNLTTYSSNPDIVVSINYILVHLAASNDANRALLMTNDNLLYRLKEILRQQDSTPTQTVKLSCVWIIINLTWKDDTSANDEDDNEEEDENLDVDPAVVSAMELDGDSHVARRLRSRGRLSSNSANQAGGDPEDHDKFQLAKNRAMKFIEMGFYPCLQDLSSETNLDLKERAQTAIFQLGLYERKVTGSFTARRDQII